MAEGRSKQDPDWWLLISVLLLIAIGIIMVFSASQYFAQYYPYDDAYYFLKKQLVNALVGAIGMFVAYKIDFRIYRRASYAAFAALLCLLVFMVASSNIDTIGGAQRWLGIGNRGFQPSELAKLILPMVMAKWTVTHREDLHDLKHGFLPALGLIALTSGLIFAQKDLSSSVVVAASGFIVLMCAGARWLHIGGLFLSGAVAAVAAVLLSPFRMDRIWAWMDPWAYAQDEGWQTVQSLMAIGSGGLTGVGLGSGGSKWYYLPERHTDFIFSVLCEEMGFLGACFVVLLLFFIVWRGVMIAVHASNTYAGLLGIGIIGSIAVQSVMNLGVATGLLPVTGITLPFMSYGGTSLVVSMTGIGILLNISRQRR